MTIWFPFLWVITFSFRRNIGLVLLTKEVLLQASQVNDIIITSLKILVSIMVNCMFWLGHVLSIVNGHFFKPDCHR